MCSTKILNFTDIEQKFDVIVGQCANKLILGILLSAVKKCGQKKFAENKLCSK